MPAIRAASSIASGRDRRRLRALAGTLPARCSPRSPVTTCARSRRRSTSSGSTTTGGTSSPRKPTETRSWSIRSAGGSRGYSQRFGIACMDFETLERVPKASYHWYRDVIAAQRNGGAPAPSLPGALSLNPGVSRLRRGPPSTSGPGHSPFKAVARVRIPLGASAAKPCKRRDSWR